MYKTLNFKDIRIACGYLRQEDFASFLGVSRSVISNIERGWREPSRDILLKIVSKCNVNGHWLLTGEGEMFLQPKQEHKGNIIPYISNVDGEEEIANVDVVGCISAGLPLEISDLGEEPLEVLRLPCSFLPRGKWWCFKVNGQSMDPEIRHDDYVFIRYITDWSLANGRICAVRVDGEATLKRVQAMPELKRVGLLAVNHNFKMQIYDPDTSEVVLIGILYSTYRKY